MVPVPSPTTPIRRLREPAGVQRYGEPQTAVRAVVRSWPEPLPCISELKSMFDPAVHQRVPMSLRVVFVFFTHPQNSVKIARQRDPVLEGLLGLDGQGRDHPPIPAQ